MFRHAFTHGEFKMVGIVDISENEEGPRFDVKVDWVGFDERVRGSHLRLYETVPRSFSSRSCES